MSTDLGEDEVFCRDCGNVIKERAEICPECGIRQRDPESSTPEKSPGLAAVASFLIPGLGQVYNGQIAKGIITGAITIVAAITVVGLILALPLWIWLIYDAYKVAERGGSSPSGPTGGTSTPRLTVDRALMWQRDEADEPEVAERAEEIRKRFRGTKSTKVPAEDREFIFDAVRGYNPDVLPDIRDELGE